MITFYLLMAKVWACLATTKTDGEESHTIVVMKSRCYPELWTQGGLVASPKHKTGCR